MLAYIRIKRGIENVKKIFHCRSISSPKWGKDKKKKSKQEVYHLREISKIEH